MMQCQLHGVESVQQLQQHGSTETMQWSVEAMAQQMQQFNQCNSTVQQMHCYNASAPMQSRQFHGGVDCFTKQLALDTGGHRSDPRAVTDRGLRCFYPIFSFAFGIHNLPNRFCNLAVTNSRVLGGCLNLRCRLFGAANAVCRLMTCMSLYSKAPYSAC